MEHILQPKKIWVDKKSSQKCIMLYPRSFDITHGALPYWAWDCYDESSNENIEVAILKDVCRLEIWGNFKISDLSSGVNYEIALIVKLTTQAKGWEYPFKLTVKLPNEAREIKRQYSLLEKPRGEWIELDAGSFKTTEGETGEGDFFFSVGSLEWKSGLIIKGLCIRPKT